jgi:hypothetical protein
MVAITAVVGSALSPCQHCGRAGVAQLAQLPGDHRAFLPLLGIVLCCVLWGRTPRHGGHAVGGAGDHDAGPDFDFGLSLGLDGAAIVGHRASGWPLGLHGVWCATACCRGWTSTFRADAKTVMSVASPAILTNLATPVAAL